jgi:glyoxylase-like metal-dependent hydrolase (beta-lactamase superfamily II)
VLSHAWEADVIAGERKAQSASLKPMRPFRTYPFQLGIFLNKPPHEPCPVDEAVAEGDAVGPLQVLHAPGHSPGHLAFHLAEHGLLIAGDAIVTWPRLEAGWRAFTLSPVDQRESLARFAGLEPRIVAVGHGDEVTEDAAAKVHAFAGRT